MKIAVIDKAPSNENYTKYFKFKYDLYHLSTKKVKKLLVKDIDIDIDVEDYDFIILIGADATKRYVKSASVVNHQGYLLEDKYIPLINPAMLAFKPASKPAFERALDELHKYIEGTKEDAIPVELTLIDSEEEALHYIGTILQSAKVIALDSETSALYPRDGEVLGISISTSETDGVYISADSISEDVAYLLQDIYNTSKVIFHNAKFDMHFFKYNFGWEFPDFEDTILLHYCLDEQSGTHSLKQLAIKYTDLGDYDKDLDVYKREYCRKYKVKLSDFTYDLIPFDILGKYAAKDTIATYRLFKIFSPIVEASPKLRNVYRNILLPGSITLQKVENNGVPFNKELLKEAQNSLGDEIYSLMEKLYRFDSINNFEKYTGKLFNPNSVNHLREVLFSYEGLPVPSKRTATGAISTDAEVLEELSQNHELPKALLAVRKLRKIKSTYIDKVLPALDFDGRLRTGFNLIATTSGRLSSSGKLNMQQLPRDNKIVKRCIRARDGWKIVSQDLSTAEMYIAAVLSGDKVLQNFFKTGGDYHGFMAKLKFGLPCDANEVATLYPKERQSAKTISFEILYKLNLREEVLDRFPQLKRWLKKVSADIRKKGYTYQFFGRKRRLPNVFSTNKGEADHEVRSGVNALVQGPASDINLLACIDMVRYIEETGMKALIFGLVHDSILAEVPDNEITHYTAKLKEFTQEDRGLSIPGYPIGIDVEIGQDYSFE